MIARFDSFDRFEVPKMYVCSPGCTYSSQTGLLSSVSGILFNTSDEELVLRFNEESELNFRIPCIPPDDETESSAYMTLYKSLKNRRMIFIDDVGFFIITEVKDGFDGVQHYKDVQAHSCEVEIENKALPYIADGTYQFEDLLDTVVAAVPLWTIGHIDSSVAEKYRTFEDVSADLNCLGFMQQDMQDAYECIFIYDIVNRVINVYDQNDYVRDTHIHITEDDLIRSMEVSENSDDLYTALTVQGDEELNISPVNPLGANTIYNFDYYLSWMSPALSQKVAEWQEEVAEQSGAGGESGAGKNLVNEATNIVGKYISSSGSILSGDDAQCTALIPVVAGQDYTWSLNSWRSNSNGTNRWHGYDSSGEWVQQIAYRQRPGTSGELFTMTATIPSGISFVRLSYGNTDTNVMLERGSSKTDYEPYTETYYSLNLRYYTALESRSDTQAEIDAINTQLTMYRRCRENVVAEYGTSQVAGYNEVIENSGGLPIVIDDDVGVTLASIDSLIEDTESALAEQEDALAEINATITSLLSQIDAIRESVSITSYFTQSELDELNNYIFEGQYTDEYITVTDQMDYEEKFQQMKTLYDRAIQQLERISQPTQEYSVDVDNFIFEKEFEPWSSQLETGCLINVDLGDDDVAMLFLTDFTINYSDETLSMTFGNRFTKFSPKSLFDDVLGDVRKSANTLNYIKEILYPIKDGEFNQMKEALQNARNLTKADVMSSSGETVLIDDTGYTGRRKLSDGTYDPKQIKINGRNIVFTDDAWLNATEAIGEILVPDPNDPESYVSVYGINAQAILGDLIMGNELRIVNGDGQDMFDVTEEQISASLENTILSVVDGKISTAINDYNEGVQSQFVETANGLKVVTGKVDTLKDSVDDKTDDINDNIEKLQGYIRASGLDGIELGRSDSEYKLKVTNSGISILSGDESITYWTSQDFVSPKTLVVPIGGQIRIGDFAFIPRESGSLDFTWVGD